MVFVNEPQVGHPPPPTLWGVIPPANNDNAYRVDGGRERHAADDDQQIAERQVEYVYVGHVSHVLVPEEYQHQRAVADGPDDEYDGEQCGHDVSLRPVGVIVTDGRRRHTAAVVVRVVVVGHGVHAVHDCTVI